MTVSIIMRSKNSDWVIDEALAALYAQTFRDFELLVVDSGSTDRTLEIVRKYPCRVIEIPPQDYIPGAVLNNAIREVRGDTLVFQNSDVVPLSPHTLERLLAPLEDPKVVAAFGRQVPRPEAHSWVRRDYSVSFPEVGPAPEWMAFSLALASMKRVAWEKHPFYTDAWGSEDTEWGVWAKRSGLNVRYVPDAPVMHSHNYTLKEIFGRRFIEGEADAFIYQGKESVPRLARRVLRSTLSDTVYHVKNGDLPGLVAAPVRRAVYHYGYFKGHRHGEDRRKTGNSDVSVGQNVVLTQYGGAGASEAR